MFVFAAPSEAVQILDREEFIRKWRQDAAFEVAPGISLYPTFSACIRYHDALRMGMPALPLALADVDGKKNYASRAPNLNPYTVHLKLKSLGL